MKSNMRAAARRAMLFLLALPLAPQLAHAQCGAATGQPLTFSPFGDFGTVGQRQNAWQLTATGGTPPYRFSIAPGSTIPGYRVGMYPDTPSWIGPGGAAFFGQAPAGTATGVPFTTNIQLTDCAGATVTNPVTFRLSPIEISMQWLPGNLSEGQAVSFPLSAVGGQPPYTYRVVQGNLPPGLVLNATTGLLSGTVSVGSAGQSYFTMQVQDSAGSTVNYYYGYTISPLNITSSRFIVATNGQPLASQIQVTGGTPPYHFRLDNCCGLPSGISVSSNGIIGGTPTYADSYVWGFNVDVSDSAPVPNMLTAAFGIVIEGPSPARIGIAPRYQSVELMPDGTRAKFYMDGPAIFGGVPPWTCSLTPGSQLPPGATLNQLSSNFLNWSFDRCLITGTVLTAGDYNFSLHITDSLGNFGDFPVTWHIGNISIVNPYPPYAPNIPYLNQPYAQPLLLVGGTPPYTIGSASPYPDGLTIQANDPNAVLAGTSLEAGYSLPLNLNIMDSLGSYVTSETFLNAFAAPNVLTLGISNGAQPAATVNQYFQTNLDVYGPVHNPPYTVQLLGDPNGPQPNRTTLPAGLTLLTSGFNHPYDLNAVARIEGTPTESGDFSYRLSIQDANGNLGVRRVTLHVNPAGFSLDVSPDVQITTTAFTYDRRSRVFNATVMVKNTSTTTLNGPLSVVLTNLTPGVTALNPTATAGSGPYFTFSNLPLAPNSTGSFFVQFTNSGNARINFVPKTYSGQPQ